MRCEQCNKFVSQEPGDVEVQDIAYDGQVISGSVRIVQCCVECNSELKEAYFDLEEEAKLCINEAHTHEVTYEEPENTDRAEGKGRYAKTFYGFSMEVEVSCKECKLKESVEIKDDIAAGSMDEL